MPSPDLDAARREAERERDTAHEDRGKLISQALAAEADRDALTAVCNESNAVCACGCPPDMHESYGEDGESRGEDGHECVRTSRTVAGMLDALRDALAEERRRNGVLYDQHVAMQTALVEERRRRLLDLADAAPEPATSFLAASRSIYLDWDAPQPAPGMDWSGTTGTVGTQPSPLPEAKLVRVTVTSEAGGTIRFGNAALDAAQKGGA